MLALTFPPEDYKRVEALNRRAQDGELAAEEASELDEYVRVGDELAVIKAKARLCLKRAGLPG